MTHIKGEVAASMYPELHSHKLVTGFAVELFGQEAEHCSGLIEV